MTARPWREWFAIGALRRARPDLHRQIQVADAYQRVFGDPGFLEGQIVFRDLMQQAGVLEIASDPADSRFYDGKRAIGLHVLQRLRWSAGELAKLGEEVTFEQLALLDTGAEREAA